MNWSLGTSLTDLGWKFSAMVPAVQMHDAGQWHLERQV